MSSRLQLKALMKKNLILMKRNWCSSLCEILFPIVLMLLLVLIRQLIKVDENGFNYTDEIYIRNESAAFVSSNSFNKSNLLNDFITWNDMTYRNPFKNCLKKSGPKRNAIALVSNSLNFTNTLQNKINQFIPQGTNFSYKLFENKTALFDYVKDIRYGQVEDLPQFCFGLTFLKTNELTYNISMHFYDSNVVNVIKEIPTTMVPALDPFKVGPDMESYDKWINSGYLQFQQVLNEMILADLIGNAQAELSFGIIPEKYKSVYFDKFGDFIGAIISFFLIIAYLCPLCILVFRMVQEKESRAKEGMKIMGLSSFTYFLSFFLFWLIQNTLYSLINALILTQVLKYVNFIFIFIFLWLYGMTLFSFAYLLQATMNKTRVAIIMTVLLYFTMYFISAAVLQQDIQQSAKLFLSIMPPTCLGFGLFTLSKFDSNQVNFGVDQINLYFNNFSVANMYSMLSFDIIIYLFLGYYLENVLTQQFGIKKPFYFLCTKSHWFKKQKNKVAQLTPVTDNINEEKKIFEKFNYVDQTKIHNNIEDIGNKKDLNEKLISRKEDYYLDSSKDNSKNNNITEDKNKIRMSLNNSKNNGVETSFTRNFQSEQIYKEKTGESLNIINLKKEFEDGKIAVDGLNLNIYKNEIFALLGHNGAGKSTTISILTGLYEATSGEAIYDDENILEADQMIEFRKKLGICPQNDVLFNDLTVKEHLEMFSIFKGIKTDKIEYEVNKILSDLYLENKKSTLAKFLSGGEKRKLSIAIALIGGSQIVFLDEPSSGMDITSRRNLWEILKKCANDRIIVLTTHYMEEAAVLGNRIGIMSNGKLRCSGNALFLIDRFGKYISLNIFKKENSDDTKIIDFVKKTLKDKVPSFTTNGSLMEDIETEILSEEILIRIPKTNDFSFQKFFEEFDQNLDNYNIKTYEASMPSLEDVFLNVSAETNSKLKIDDKNDKDKDHENNDLNGFNSLEVTNSTFNDQFVGLFKKRIINLIRDKKSFLLEIVVPFILVLVGLLISSIQFFVNSPGLDNTMNNFPLPQKILTGKYQIPSNVSVDNYFLTSNTPDIEIEAYNNEVDSSNLKNNLIDFNNYLFKRSNITKSYIYQELSKSKNFGNYLFLNLDKSLNRYSFVLYVNTNARYSPVIFGQLMQSKIINYASGKQITINSSTEPFPLTSQVKNQGQARNISNLVFFVSVAFALIPANFITIIIREREINTKHLQILSGVTKFNYWFANFIFELIKYYIIAGLISIVIFLFDDFVRYFWIFYVLYGPSMIVFTYALSFLFNDESSGQNGIILLNFLLGTLAGNVVLIFRVLPDLIKTGKLLANIFRIVPSFALTYGYSQLLLSDLLIVVDKNFDPNITMLSLDYAGSDVLFLGICFFVSLLILIGIESNLNFVFFSKPKSNNKILNSEINGNIVNEDKNFYSNEDIEKNINYSNNFSIQVKDLVKNYYIGGTLGFGKKEFKAVKNLSFDLRFGECFALLGVTGAGKTSTFKCLTAESKKDGGFISINGIELNNNLNQIKNLIGYCPQKDSIFEYMTVYENLDFYARIKGIDFNNRDKIITSLINEMNLQNYKNKISGNLSGGNKRKLSVAISLIGNPPIILLDEPSTGMDPEARRFMWAVIYKISRRNKKSSVILTTHSMEEAETLCRRIGIMVDGEFKCLGTNQYLKDTYGDSFEISYSLKNMNKNDFEKISNIAYENIDSLNDLIDSNEALIILNKLNKNLTHKNILMNFVFNTNEREDTIINKEERILVSKKNLIYYIYYVEKVLNLVSELSNSFNKITINYLYENNVRLKLPKNSEKNPTIGFLLGLLENKKSEFQISEFSVTQTSLEQIFNKFASQKEEVLNYNNKEYVLTIKDLQ